MIQNTNMIINACCGFLKIQLILNSGLLEPILDKNTYEDYLKAFFILNSSNLKCNQNSFCHTKIVQ